MILGYVYKIRPNQEQSSKIEAWLDMLRANYNWCLADRITNYQQRFIQGEYCDLRTKATIFPLSCSIGAASGDPWRVNGTKRSAVEIQITSLPALKQCRPWYKEIDSTVLQQNLKFLNLAFENFFSRGRGFPKFKNRSNFRSFTFATGVKLKGNKIYLPKLGWIRYFNSRPIPEGFKLKSVTVRKKADGYHVSIRIENQDVPDYPLIQSESVKTITGLDLGIGKLIYCNDLSSVENPKFGTNKKTKRIQKIRASRVSAKKKGSKNRAKAQRKLSELQQKIASKRSAYQWKVAHKIVRKSDAIAVEALNIRAMMKKCKPKYEEEKGKFIKNGQTAKRALSRAIADASWSNLIEKIEYVAAKSGKIVLKVNPKHTSQECSVCHHICADNRDGEKFLCVRCGHIDSADFQAADNIRRKAIEMYGLKIEIKPKKVRADCSEPKQLTLFQTLSPELTGVKRKYQYTHKGKRIEPGNLVKQLTLFDQDNNYYLT